MAKPFRVKTANEEKTTMIERAGAVTFQGNPLTLIGETLKVGAKAPDFSLLDNSLGPVTLAASAGKARLISVVPSLDTPVCDTQTRKFNEQIADLGDGVVCYTVSADLPFAQARWCGNAGIDRVVTLSDHRDMAFGDAYGTHIKELRLESRAVFVIDAQGVIQYIQYVPEITQEPDYAAALAVLKAIAR
jgi:thiol peroxidase